VILQKVIAIKQLEIALYVNQIHKEVNATYAKQDIGQLIVQKIALKTAIQLQKTVIKQQESALNAKYIFLEIFVIFVNRVVGEIIVLVCVLLIVILQQPTVIKLMEHAQIIVIMALLEVHVLLVVKDIGVQNVIKIVLLNVM
jgi:hypothetical protein